MHQNTPFQVKKTFFLGRGIVTSQAPPRWGWVPRPHTQPVASTKHSGSTVRPPEFHPDLRQWLWRSEIVRRGNFVSNFCVFLKNDPLWYTFQNFVPKVYMATPIDVIVFKCRNRKSCTTGNRWNYSMDKKQTKIRLPLKLSLLRGSRPKCARASPQQCTQSAPNFIQMGSLSAEL